MTRRVVRAYSRRTEAALALLAKQIRAARTVRRFTQAELAERVGVARSTIQRVEQGDPRVEIGVFLEAAVIAGVELFGEEGPSARRLARMDDRLALLPKAVHEAPMPDGFDDF